jgi:hypothetical protein
MILIENRKKLKKLEILKFRLCILAMHFFSSFFKIPT